MNAEPVRKLRSRELRNLRIQCRLSQTQLALLSGLKQCTISRIEKGKDSWNVDSEILYREGIRKFMEGKKTA